MSSALSVTVRYQDSEGKDILLGDLPGGSHKISEVFNTYWFIGRDFLERIPQLAMKIVAEGRKDNRYEGSVTYALKTRQDVLKLLNGFGRRSKLLVGVNPEIDSDDAKYWVSDQDNPTISPDLR